MMRIPNTVMSDGSRPAHMELRAGAQSHSVGKRRARNRLSTASECAHAPVLAAQPKRERAAAELLPERSPPVAAAVRLRPAHEWPVLRLTAA